jgi:hypothetical protein
MKRSRFRNIAAGLCMAVVAGTAHAGDAALNLALPPDVAALHSGDLQSYVLTANDAVVTTEKANIAPAAPRAVEVRDPWLSVSKIHQYLGLGTIVLAAATVATAPGKCKTNCANQSPPTSGTHQSLGRATGALALAAVATGLIFHWDDMHLFEDGLRDPDTQHWLLGGAGALLLADAVRKAPGHGHSGEAELGAAMMVVAIKLTW